jgi:hypothetical protein
LQAQLETMDVLIGVFSGSNGKPEWFTTAEPVDLKKAGWKVNHYSKKKNAEGKRRHRSITGLGKLVLSCMSTEHFYSAQDIATIAAEKNEVHGAKTFAHFKKRVRAFLNADTLKRIARQEDGEGNRIYKKLN